MKKVRLDQYLTENDFYTSREQAKKAVMAGLVHVDGVQGEKPGMQIPQELSPDKISIKGEVCPWVSRGGFKLEKGIRVFDFPVENLTFLDIGASSGGFTDVLLHGGAAKVHAIDVGYGQLDYKLREDPRVHVLERTNFRYLEPQAIGAPADGSVMDVSFISIIKLFPKIKELTKPGAKGIWLIKPQFEAGREKVGKNGVVREPKIHKEVLCRVTEAAQEAGFTVLGLDVSPVKGPSGNIEFLLFTQNTVPEKTLSFTQDIEKLIQESRQLPNDK